MDKLKSDLAMSVRARYPLIYLLTWEENRALSMLREIGAGQGGDFLDHVAGV